MTLMGTKSVKYFDWCRWVCGMNASHRCKGIPALTDNKACSRFLLSQESLCLCIDAGMVYTRLGRSCVTSQYDQRREYETFLSISMQSVLIRWTRVGTPKILTSESLAYTWRVAEIYLMIYECLLCSTVVAKKNLGPNNAYVKTVPAQMVNEEAEFDEHLLYKGETTTSVIVLA